MVLKQHWFSEWHRKIFWQLVILKSQINHPESRKSHCVESYEAQCIHSSLKFQFFNVCRLFRDTGVMLNFRIHNPKSRIRSASLSSVNRTISLSLSVSIWSSSLPESSQSSSSSSSSISSEYSLDAGKYSESLVILVDSILSERFSEETVVAVLWKNETSGKSVWHCASANLAAIFFLC